MKVLKLVGVGVAAVCCILGAILAAYIGHSKRHRVEEERRRAEEDQRRKEEEEQARKALEQKMSELALTCLGCGKLAPPIPGSRNRYRCSVCGSEFPADPHGL